MVKFGRRFALVMLGVLTALMMCFGIAFTVPTTMAKAETLSTTGWTLAREGDGMFRVQNGNTYWNTYTNSVTTASMLDYTEINGKTLTEINTEKPGSITVTLQPAGGAIGSFYRVNINTEIAGFTVNDIGTVVIRGGWSHTDANATYTIDTDLYFAHAQNAWASDGNNWKCIPTENVVDISDDIQLQDQGIQATVTRAILISTSNNVYWAGDPITPNEGGGAFLNMLYINGTSIKEWNNKAHAALSAGEITDISYGSDFWLIDNGPAYAPIAVSNSGYTDGLGSISQVWIPTNYISDVASFKVAKGFANLQGDTLYYVSKDIECVKSGQEFKKVDSSVDISDAFKLLVQDYTSSNGTMLYYLHTNNVQYWTHNYETNGAFAINEKEWKGQGNVNLQGGAVQMSFLEVNGVPVYDINAGDNGSYGATQGNIASGGKYAPILAFLTPQEVGNAIKLQIPTAYPNGSGSAADNHKTIAIKKGFYVLDTATGIKYEVTRDLQWDYIDGAWGEHVEKIETTVTDARLFGSSADAFAGIQLAGSDYNLAPGTYAGEVQTAKTFARSANFLSHVLIDDQPLARPGEAFLNVWNNYGYFTFRPGNNSATKITILAGCEFPTYAALAYGTKEVYVTTQDVAFVKDESGNWVQGSVVEKEVETSVMGISNNGAYAVLQLDGYVNPEPNGTEKNNNASIEKSNIADHITYVDGDGEKTAENATFRYYTQLNTTYPNSIGIIFEEGMKKADLEAVKSITIKAGTKFPSYAYINGGDEQCFITKEDVTFYQVGTGDGRGWVNEKDLASAGEYKTAITNVQYGRGPSSWMMFTLSNKDYPNAGTYSNIATNFDQIAKLNLFDKVIVDGYSIRTLLLNNSMIEDPKVNLFVANCFAFRIPGKADALDSAKKVTIKAGAQFPSLSYILTGEEAYYVTTEDFTFVYDGNADGTWQKQYKVTFVVDGEAVAESTYLYDKGEKPTLPEVPVKAGYNGVWESFTAGSAANITVEAVYSKITVKGTTSIRELKRIDNNSNILVINPTNSDYPVCDESHWNLGLDVSYLQKFNLLDYITINGHTLRELGVSSMAIHKFTRAGLGLETSLSDTMTIVFNEGCQLPSYEFWQNPDGELSCYTIDTTYTAVYAAAGEAAFTITGEKDTTMDNFDKHYILSDLQNDGYTKTDCFKDGYEVLQTSEGLSDVEAEKRYRYGYIDSTSFTLSFDMMFNGATYYQTFNVNLGTEGHGGTKFHFGWRFYLLRGNATDGVSQNICVEYFSNTRAIEEGGNSNIPGSANKVLGNAAFVPGETYHITIGYKLVNAATGEVLVYTSVNNMKRLDTYILGGNFVNFAPYINSLTMNTSISADGTVTVCDPGADINNAPHTVILDGVGEVYSGALKLPAVDPIEYNVYKGVFIGWTTAADLANLTKDNLYPAGSMYKATADTTLYPVWLDFSMRKGAAVRATVGSSGLRYTVDLDADMYAALVQKGIIVETGTIFAPTDFLKGVELTHDLGAKRFITQTTNKWQVENKVYTAAFTNISYDQYGRYFSARGYIKVVYGDGSEVYVYTTYNAADHSRSIYNVATAAFNDIYSGNEVVQSYVNNVADIVIDAGLNVSKNENAVGNYNVSAETSGDVLNISVSNGVKAAIVNGVRIVMGKTVSILIENVKYSISGYTLSTDGVQLSLTLTEVGSLDKQYYIDLLQAYLDSNIYTAIHKDYVDQVTNEAIDAINSNGNSIDMVSIYANAVKALDAVKTAEEEATTDYNATKLGTPVVSKGLGYTVTWPAVANADYYTIIDSNDYRETNIVFADGNKALVYKAEVVGNHSIKVVAHSYFENFRNSAESNTVKTPEVKPVFSYKSMLDGLYKFSDGQMSTMGISKSGCYYDSSDKKYFVYYNKDIGWTPYPAQATDWTSPAEFPAHAQRLKDMGNNIILIAHDTNAEFKKDDTWSSSRLKYVMDTAWSMGMKVLVCDRVFYDLSMSDGSGKGAGSISEVKSAITARGADFAAYVQHPAFYGFSLDDEPYGKWISAMSHTISALDEACENLGVEDPFYLACLFQAQGGELGKELYLTQGSLLDYYNKWLAIDGVDGQYLYVDIYTQHAMGQPTNRYNTSFEVVYHKDYLKGQYKFHQAITAHTQNEGVLLEQDMYMSLLYAAAHNVAGYSWFCYFPISGETSGSMVGFDGNGYGNGIGNNVETGKSFYNAAKTAGYQFELIQGLLDGYEWDTREHNDSKNYLKTTLSNGLKEATMYVNADVDNMSGSYTVTAIGSECYLVGYNVGTAEAPYQKVISGSSVTLQPGQAVICME